MTNDHFSSTTNSTEGLIISLPEWGKVKEAAIEYFISSQGKTDIIEFDNADPGFPPFEPAIATVVHGLKSKPEAVSKYTLSNDSYNSEILIQFIESMGILPPKNIDSSEKKTQFSARNISSGIGATHLYMLALGSMLQEGDVFMVTAPTYGLFSLHPIMEKVNLQTVQLHENDGWKLNPDTLDKRIEEINAGKQKVKAFLHMNPHNPLGTVEGEKEVIALSEVFKKHEVFVIDDLVYSGTEYGKNIAVPLASIDGMFERTLTLFSLSKAYGAPGLRSAMAVGSKEIISSLVGQMLHTIEAPPVTSQLALIGALNMLPQTVELRNNYLRSNAVEYESRRNLVDGWVNGYENISPSDVQSQILKYLERARAEQHNLEIEPAYELLRTGIKVVKTLNRPNAGYFQLLDFSGYKGRYYGDKRIDTSMDIAKVVAEQSGVIVLPGELMQFEGEQMVARITYAYSPDKILKGLVGISHALEKLKFEKYELKK